MSRYASLTERERAARRRRRVATSVLVASHLAASSLAGQSPMPAASPDSTPLRAIARWDTSRFVGSRTTLSLELTRALAQGERLALLVGSSDVSGAVRVQGRRAEYAPAALRLPAGATEAIAYIVTAGGEWQEAGRAALRVRTRTGLDAGSFTPSADLASTGQLDQFVPEGAPPPERRTWQDLTLRLGVGGRAVRDAWEMTLQSNAVGASEETQRLRYADRQDRAPTLDLADYQLQLRRGPLRAAVGNLSVGANRYLLAGYGSRGVSAGVQLHPAVAIDAAAVNGTNVVGWDNLLGVSDGDHRMLTTGIAVEFVPSRPGAFHVDVQALDGSILPRTGFTQGAVTDAERSRGYGVQLSMSDASQRLRVGAGLSQSRFRNPSDPLLAGDTTVVAARSETRRARFGELGVQILRDLALFGSTRASLGATARHERIDPLYRSVGAFVQGDQQMDGGELTGSIGALSIQGALSRGRDNLADIPSILTTRTTRRAVSLAAPLHGLVGVSPRGWLPMATFAWEGTAQAGDGVPTNSDFQASHVPDQVNRVRTASLSWSPSRMNISYRWNESLQDNRQPGRERADLRTRVHGVQFALNGIPRLTPALDGSVERQQLFETGAQLRTSRLGTLWQAQVTRTLAFNGNVSHMWNWDPFAQRRTRNLELQGELSQGFTVYRAADGGTQGRVFVRYARTRAAFYPLIPDATLVPQLLWTINAGSSFRFF